LLPVLVERSGMQGSAALIDGFVGELAVAYTAGPPPGAPGPPPGQQVLTWDDLAGFGITHRELRRQAAESLYAALDQVGIHGQPPALMLSFGGLESSVLLAHPFWDDLERCVPGELVVGVPARDVVIITGSESYSGMEKLRRAVDRVFFAGGPHLLSRDLLVRRQRRWDVWQTAPLPVSPPVSPVIAPRPAPPTSVVPVGAGPMPPPGYRPQPGHRRAPQPGYRPLPAPAVRPVPQRLPPVRTPRSNAPTR
jgi:hypothetical protein